MDIKATKLELLQQLLETDNEDLLGRIKKLLEEEMRSPALSKSHRKILDVRLAKHESNPAAGRSWKDVKKRIKARL